MPASASASSSSASSSSALCASVMLTIRVSGSSSSVEPAGHDEVRGQDLGAGLQALDVDLDVLGDVRGLGLDLDGRGLDDDQGLGGGLADEVDRDVDGDLLALADDDEVDVLELALDRVDLDLLGQRQLGLAVDVELEQGVGAAGLSAIMVS